MEAPTPFVVENHDEAYHIWRRAGVASRTLIHIDAHHDMAWLDEAGELSIGNYICQAIKDGIVGEVVWVVPDASWDTPRDRAAIQQHLKTLIRHYSARPSSIQSAHRHMSTQLLGIRVTVCAVNGLRQFPEPVLLDIDTDFFAIPVVAYSRFDRPGEWPWTWPDDLVATLRQKKLQADIVTIAYSVAGGYTPLKWKYLGDALALEWQSPSQDSAPARAGFQCLRQAATAARAGDRITAFGALELAAAHLPQSGAPFYHLALLHLSSNSAEAQRCFSRAVQADPTYRGPYCGRGFVCLSEGRLADAATEFDRVLALDPADPFALLGRARVAFRRRHWTEAETSLSAVVKAAPRLVDAHRYLGDTLVKLSRDAEAGAAYSRSLKLVLEGEVSIEDMDQTTTAGDGPRDARHGSIHAALARIDARAGRLRSANSGYRMAIAAGADGPAVRGRLAWVCVRRGDWIGAVSVGAQALAAMPRAFQKATRRAIRRMRQSRTPLISR